MRLLLANPAARVASTPDKLEAVTPGGGLRIQVRTSPENVAYELEATRSIASSDDFYWCQGEQGLTCSDNLHDLLTHLPVGMRRIDPPAVLDHFLFRTVPGDRTYLKDVGRLGAGSTLAWTRQGRLIVREPTPMTASPSADYLRDIERFLESELHRTKGVSCVVNLLSGGIDSTLIQTFLPRGTPSCSVAFSAPEYAFEIEYACDASALTGSTHAVQHLTEHEWLRYVVDAIRAMALPPQHMQTGLIHRAFDAPYSGFITGQYADALFGLGLARHRDTDAGYFEHRGIKRWLTGILPLGALPRYLRPHVESVRARPWELESLASRVARYAEVDLLIRLFGRDAVQSHLHRRYVYANGRVRLNSRDSLIDRQLHAGHWIDFYCDDAVSLWRQLGFSSAKQLFAPFATDTAAQTALNIPTRERYVAAGRIKYLLKDLLARRLPAYDVDKKKGHSFPQLHRYAEASFFDPLFEQYPVPECAEHVWKAAKRSGLPAFPETLWNLLTISIWHHDVLRNGDAQPHATTRTFAFT